jgi:predicted transcriptional regulator of viral defense system
MRTQSGSPSADAVIHALAAAQHGVMARRQLVEAGLKPGAIGRRVRAGRLVRIHPGVYAAGHAELAFDGRWMAAVLACGPGAALTHRAATAAYALRPAWRQWLEVSVLNDISVPGILIHRVRDLSEVTTLRGIPITTVARTLTDLADVTSPRILQQVLDQAEIMRLHAPVECSTGGAARAA